MLSILLWFAFWLESEEGHCKTSVRVISIVSVRKKRVLGLFLRLMLQLKVSLCSGLDFSFY